MEERYNYIITWSSETGWQINDEMGVDLFTKGFIQVRGGKVENEEEAEKVLELLSEANIGQHLHERDNKLRALLAEKLTEMDELLMYPESAI
jgi:hypothetical protein